MNLHHKLFEDPLFYKWIYRPTPEVDEYWNDFMNKHPREAKVIQLIKKEFEESQKNQIHLTIEEEKELKRHVLDRLTQIDHQRNFKKTFLRVAQYAAVAVFFLLLGGGLSHILFQHKVDKRFAMVPAPASVNIQEPILIVGNKKEIVLKPGKSELEYSNEGNVLIDKEHLIESNTNEGVKVDMNTLVIPYGNSSTIVLSDGTKVWLNAGSRLVYPSRFVDKQREVLLVGEAFFDVAKNEEQPFIVKTPDINVSVLGTRFNISAYPEDNVIQTVLTEGKVVLGWNEEGFFQRKTELNPGEMVTANKREKVTKVYTVNTDYYTSWKEGYLMFSNSDLSRIVKKLERYYNISFRYANPLNGEMKVSGKLDVTNDKEVVFTYIASLTGLEFNKINDAYYEIK